MEATLQPRATGPSARSSCSPGWTQRPTWCCRWTRCTWRRVPSGAGAERGAAGARGAKVHVAVRHGRHQAAGPAAQLPDRVGRVDWHSGLLRAAFPIVVLAGRGACPARWCPRRPWIRTNGRAAAPARHKGWRTPSAASRAWWPPRPLQCALRDGGDGSVTAAVCSAPMPEQAPMHGCCSYSPCNGAAATAIPGATSLRAGRRAAAVFFVRRHTISMLQVAMGLDGSRK